MVRGGGDLVHSAKSLDPVCMHPNQRKQARVPSRPLPPGDGGLKEEKYSQTPCACIRPLGTDCVPQAHCPTLVVCVRQVTQAGKVTRALSGLRVSGLSSEGRPAGRQQPREALPRPL